MIECLILGDSIALGVGQARPACETVARVGVSSNAYLQTLFASAPKAADHIVISLGVNDDPAAHTVEALRRVRAQLRAKTVTWLLPGLREAARRAIQTVAAENRDQVLDTRAQTGPDHLHPTGAGYRQIAAAALSGAAPAGTATAAVHATPVLPSNPVRWLPMLRAPAAQSSLLPGYPFRLWSPAVTGPGAFPGSAFRVTPAAMQR